MLKRSSPFYPTLFYSLWRKRKSPLKITASKSKEFLAILDKKKQNNQQHTQKN